MELGGDIVRNKKRGSPVGKPLLMGFIDQSKHALTRPGMGMMMAMDVLFVFHTMVRRKGDWGEFQRTSRKLIEFSNH